MKILVTGAAGFIGSHLSGRLLDAGHEVLGVDCLTDFYEVGLKRRNLAPLVAHPRFRHVEADLAQAELEPLVKGVSAVFHHAAQAGVRTSWGSQFRDYTRCNVEATQRLLEACKSAELRKFVYASSSSVYGRTDAQLMNEQQRPQPISPYGVTKLAAEHLVQLYHWSYGVPAISLRYFTVFGPRQRPDMAFHRFVRRALEDRPIQIYGDGYQTRDFTYIEDVVEANLAAMECDAAGEVLNIGGGARIDLFGVLEILGRILGRPVRREHQEAMRGDMRHTGADVSRAQRVLGYAPKWSVAEGLERQVAWQRELYGAS
jgi:nucleoside-diphosphate-sugar epimerase